jgi:hypothetical protein
MRRRVVLANVPAAGAEWLITVPAGKFWLVKAVTVTLTQGGSGTPQPILVLADGAGHTFAEGVGATTQQAQSSTTTYTWAPAMVLSGIQPQTGFLGDQHAQAPLPLGEETFLVGGWTLGSHTPGITAQSQYSAATLYVAENG